MGSKNLRSSGFLTNDFTFQLILSCATPRVFLNNFKSDDFFIKTSTKMTNIYISRLRKLAENFGWQEITFKEELMGQDYPIIQDYEIKNEYEINLFSTKSKCTLKLNSFIELIKVG